MAHLLLKKKYMTKEKIPKEKIPKAESPKAETTKAKTKEPVKELNLTEAILSSINEQFKVNSYKTAYHLTDPDVISDVTDWVSTGCSVLDLAISNRPNGGLPVGRIVEITGLEQSGKSLLAAHVLSNTQKKGGIAVYIDTEAAVSREFMEAIGMDINKMLYVPLETMEDIFMTIESIIERVRRTDKQKLVTIVVDSVMGATTKQEIESDYDKDGYATSKSIIISKGMRKITNMIARQKICLVFTNQLRQKIGAMAFADQWTTSGGKALAFHSSVRLRLSSMGQLKGKVNGVEVTIGGKTKCVVQKNRMGPPLKTVIYDIYFDSGIDNYGNWLTHLKDYKIVKQSGAWYELEYADEHGEMVPHKFQSKDFKTLLKTVPGLQDYLYEKICDNYIMEYKPNVDFGIDDVTLDENIINEND